MENFLDKIGGDSRFFFFFPLFSLSPPSSLSSFSLLSPSSSSPPYSPVVKALSFCNQGILAPAVIELKAQLGPNHMTKDISGTWMYTIKIEYPNGSSSFSFLFLFFFFFFSFFLFPFSSFSLPSPHPLSQKRISHQQHVRNCLGVGGHFCGNRECFYQRFY